MGNVGPLELHDLDLNDDVESQKDYGNEESVSNINVSASSPRQKLNILKLLWHIVITILIFAQFAAFTNYLRFKFYLYSREHRELIRRPWLILLALCELVYYVSSLFAVADFVLPPRFRPKPPPPPLRRFPTVDIFLPCCKEPTDIAEDSIRAALNLDYPTDRFRILVLDDGTDENLKAFCEALMFHAEHPVVKYLRRVKVPGVPHNFKCGNLNYGLEHSDAEFVVMMDADMILHPTFLQEMIPHIVSDPQVSFVQIPQAFYNLPVGDPLNDAGVFGYDRIMLHRDTFGMTHCVGTGAVFRRKHLDEIGGFQSMSITEDTLTAFVLFNRGYKSVYLNRKLQAGITPWTLEGYIKQRRRWCQGAIQQFSATWREMLGPRSKLSFLLKIYFFWHTAFYFLFVVTTVMLLIFITSLAFHLDLVVGDSDDTRKLIVHFSILIIFWRLAWLSVWVGLPQPIQSRNRDESHFWWMTPYFFKTIWQSVFFYSSTFIFTPTSNIDRVAANAKQKQSKFMKRLTKLKHVRAHVCYIVLVVGLVIWRSVWLVKHGGKNCRDDFYVIAISLFLLSTCAHMLIPIMYVLRPPNFKPSQRKSLLRYKEGVAQYAEGDYLPKWHWSIVIYEVISTIALLGFWVALLVVIVTKVDRRWCKDGTV